jgi:DNA-binding FadR family transcriptional regulator
MVETQRLYAEIAQKLAREIAAGKYQIGQRLPSERDLAQRFQVSRPTIREAIIALELDNLVDVRIGSGVYVTNVHPPPAASLVSPTSDPSSRLRPDARSKVRRAASRRLALRMFSLRNSQPWWLKCARKMSTTSCAAKMPTGAFMS